MSLTHARTHCQFVTIALSVMSCILLEQQSNGQALPPRSSSPLEDISPNSEFQTDGRPATDRRASEPERPRYLVAGVQVRGNQAISQHKIFTYLKTRIDREFDPEMVQADVRELVKTGLFRDVKTYTELTPRGMIVTFEVFELPMIQYIQFVGNRNVTDRKLGKEAGLKVGEALSPFRVNEARQKLEDYYRSNGFTKSQVELLEGNRVGDRGVVFVISEDYLQRIWDVDFVGNTIASDGRLKTQIKSKPSIFKYAFGGKVDRRQIEEDTQRLTAYYRGLGYFNAKIGRELKYDSSGKWLSLIYIINEGPQYHIRNVSVIGNEKFDTNSLVSRLLLHSGESFNATKMQVDENELRDIYGSQGHIFADIKADPRFLEEPGWLDLVYTINEGEQYRVGKINIKIAGEYPHTRQNVILNRISLRPGDIIDIREIRASQRRLIASQLFVNEPARGVTPELTVVPPDLQKKSNAYASRERDAETTTNYRGQSPDDDEHFTDLDVWLVPQD